MPTLLDAASLAGKRVHSPCGGHGTCRKCVVAITAKAGFVPDADAEAQLTPSEAQELRQHAHVPADLHEPLYFVYACMQQTSDAITHIYYPDYTELTGAGVKRAKPYTDRADFAPILAERRITLTLPTLEKPIDTAANLTAAVREAFADAFDAFPGALDALDLPDSVLTDATAALSAGKTELYAAAAVLTDASGRVTVRVIRVTEDERPALLLAADIGTTTVALSLWNAESGEMVAENVTENPQRAHGSDVISRMSYEKEHGGYPLFREITAAIEKSVSAMLAGTGYSPDDVLYAALAGNSTMQHMAACLPTESFSVSPFFLPTRHGYAIPADGYFAKLAEEDRGNAFLHPNGALYLAPLAASYVGGDITFGLAYLLTTRPALCEDGAAAVFMDLGTNGELCTIHRDAETDAPTYLFAATAAGPALEGAHIQMGMSAVRGAISDVKVSDGAFRCQVVGGGNAVGICGSGIISGTAAALNAGLITAYGRICDDGEPEDDAYADIYPQFEHTLGEDDDGRLFIRFTEDGTEPVVLTEGDVRQVQTAKAAISAGCTVLMRRSGLDADSLRQIYIAGSFGGGIDVTDAARIGLLPTAGSGCEVMSVGNTSAKGAAMYLFSRTFRRNLASILTDSAYIELSSDPGFTDAYVNGMLFGEDEE